MNPPALPHTAPAASLRMPLPRAALPMTPPSAPAAHRGTPPLAAEVGGATQELGALIAACARTPVAAGPAALIAAVGACLPGLEFSEATRRGGWYRLGGIVDAAGARLSDTLEGWIEDRLAECDGDAMELAQRFGARGLVATRLTGSTIYLVAGNGPDASDFLQLEIEVLQEVLAQPLFADSESGDAAETAAEIVERCTAGATGEPLGPPFYSLRRLLDIGTTLDRLCGHSGLPSPAIRFFADWQASSAGLASLMCNHWVMQVSEHLDRHRQLQIGMKPLPARTGSIARLAPDALLRGTALQQALLAHDRRNGYPMAWYFDMVGAHSVPAWIATAVIEDADAGFRYLPERDLQLIRDWLHRPYVT